MLRMILDHSALIPCGDKPVEEKESIRKLGDELLEHDIVWHVSTRYLKTLHNIFSREPKHHHPLPRLQRSLRRTLKELLAFSKAKRSQCTPKPLANTRIRIHVIARSAVKSLNPRLQEAIRSYNLTEEDIEVIALAVTGTRYQEPVYLVSTDEPLLQAANQLSKRYSLNLQTLTPRQLTQQIGGSRHSNN
ncbi:MAG: hypothetical protein F7C81_01065 [Desulfurococcales archaeon]|nr:hypothetical protein [Desulfurococcales archaeon]